MPKNVKSEAKQFLLLSPISMNITRFMYLSLRTNTSNAASDVALWTRIIKKCSFVGPTDCNNHHHPLRNWASLQSAKICDRRNDRHLNFALFISLKHTSCYSPYGKPVRQTTNMCVTIERPSNPFQFDSKIVYKLNGTERAHQKLRLLDCHINSILSERNRKCLECCCQSLYPIFCAIKTSWHDKPHQMDKHANLVWKFTEISSFTIHKIFFWPSLSLYIYVYVVVGVLLLFFLGNCSSCAPRRTYWMDSMCPRTCSWVNCPKPTGVSYRNWYNRIGRVTKCERYHQRELIV